MPPQQLNLAANANGTTGGSEPELVMEEQAAEPACAICHKVEVAVGPVENRVTLQKCGQCRQVLYCSRDCQRAHWPRHKSDCAAPGSPPEIVFDRYCQTVDASPWPLRGGRSSRTRRL